MKIIFTAVFLVFAMVSTVANAAEESVVEHEDRILTGSRNNFKKTFFAVLSAAQEVDMDGNMGKAACDSAGMGNAVATLKRRELCIALSYSGVPEEELFSHIHGPAKIGSNAPVLFTLSTGTIKNDCFQLTRKQARQLSRGLFYFNVHSPRCPAGEIRGQILPVD